MEKNEKHYVDRVIISMNDTNTRIKNIKASDLIVYNSDITKSMTNNQLVELVLILKEQCATLEKNYEVLKEAYLDTLEIIKSLSVSIETIKQSL